MKRMSNLLNEETVTEDFCKAVILETLKGKRNRMDSALIFTNLDHYAQRLKNMILESSLPDPDGDGFKKYLGVDGYEVFTPSPYRFTTRMEHGKLRNLCKPELWPDQCIHHVLIKAAKKKFMARIDPYAAASIPKKGPNFLMTQIKHVLRTDSYKNTKYTLQLDIKKCFDSLKSEIVYREMTRIIKDPIWLRLFKKVIFNHPTLPIGLYISAWVVNLILKPLDDAIRAFSGTRYYYRYMDDMIIIGSNKRKLYKLLYEVITPELAKLGLQVKPNWKIFLTDNIGSDNRKGIDFVGFRMYRNKVLMRKKNFNHLRHAALRLIRFYKEGKYIPLKLCLSFVSFAATHHQVTGKTINEYLLYAKYEAIKNTISIRSAHNMKVKRYKVAIMLDDPEAHTLKPVKLHKEKMSSRRFKKLMTEMNRIGRLRHINNVRQKLDTYMDKKRHNMQIHPWKYLVPIEMMDMMFCKSTQLYDEFPHWWYKQSKTGEWDHLPEKEGPRNFPNYKKMTEKEEQAYNKKWYKVDRAKVHVAREKIYLKRVKLQEWHQNGIRYKESLSIYPNPTVNVPMTFK